jgi:hypothetical protein
MAKVITARRLEGETEKAQEFVRSYILFPSSLFGLLTIVVGVLALLYQLIVGTYEVHTFTNSSGLLVFGVLLGLGQTKYHQFLLREYPAFFASRMKSNTQRTLQRAKKQAPEVTPDHRGRGLVPWWYVIGIASMLGLSILSIMSGVLDPLAAFALPWAGFFWAKMFFWKGLIAPVAKKGKKRK